MKFNIEYAPLADCEITHNTDFYSRDLPVLFPYPRIYPGQESDYFRSETVLLTSSRTICVGHIIFTRVWH